MFLGLGLSLFTNLNLEFLVLKLLDSILLAKELDKYLKINYLKLLTLKISALKAMKTFFNAVSD